MEPSTTGRRHLLFDRYFGVVAWTFWGIGSVLTVWTTLMFAPHATSMDWVNLMAVIVAAIGIPITLVLQQDNHSSRSWRALIYVTLIWVWISFGLLLAEWVHPVDDNDAGVQLSFGLFFGMLPAMGPGMVMSHLDQRRLARERIAQEAAKEPQPVEHESDTA